MNVIESKRYALEVEAIARQLPHMACTILVTGATGMIGSAIVDTILCSDRLFNNQIKVAVAGRNEEKLKKRFNYADQNMIAYMIQDIMQPLKNDVNFDYIIHTASNAAPIAYSLYPTETLLTNVYGVNNMLEYCRAHKNTRVLLTSSFEVYGKIFGQEVYKEEDSGEIDLNAVRSCYPESKRCAEILMRCYHKQYDVDCVIARLSSIYGPTMAEDDSKAHAQFIRNALAGEDIVLKSKGSQKRTYCYLIDAISGILTVLFKGNSGEAYNISNENSVVTIADLAKTIADLCETKIIFEVPGVIEQQGFSRPQNCVLDNTKLKKIGWRGKYSLEQGIRSTIDILQELSC